MWMKPLSLFTFSVFLVLLGANLYKTQSDKFDKVGRKAQEHRSLFEMEPEQARALLDDLDVYVKKDKAMKDARDFADKTKKIKSPKKRKRALASGPRKSKKDLINEKMNDKLRDKYARLEEAFMAREDNLLEVRFMQDELRRIKEEAEMEQGNIETWSAEFIWLLMIQERLGFDEIKSIKNPSDLGMEMDDWLSMKAKAETDDFKQDILKFKGIEVENAEVDEIIAEEDGDFEPAKDREQALKNFGERNRDSREGYGEDTREAEEISFSNDEDSFEDANDYYREPTSQEDGQNSENDYEY
jgi:hypothetical protein